MLMVHKNESPPVITIFHFSPQEFLEKNFETGIFSHGDFFLQAIHPERILRTYYSMAKYFSAFIHMYMYMV